MKKLPVGEPTLKKRISLFSDEQTEYFERVTRLIEETYDWNNEKKVVIVAHSMGGLMMLHLLQSKTQEWKDKYIR